VSKKWYNYFVSVEGENATGASEDSPAAAQTIADIAASVRMEPQFTANTRGPMPSSFEDIYHAAEIQPPTHGYTVFKVAEMLKNEHIRDLPPEIKRSSVLLALEAAGVKLEEVIQDAVRRDKALDAFERVRRKSADELEAKKTEENRQVQAEMERMLAELRAKVQANNEAIAREKETFTSWLKEKQQEEQKIADTIAYFVSANPISVGATPQSDAPPKADR
jgi:hypothetical protein